MEKNVRKRISLGVIVTCLVVAATVTYLTYSPKGGIPAHFAQEMTWVKCVNPECGVEYQISKKDYFEYVEKHHDPHMSAAARLVCKECGRETIVRAVKCQECGHVFAMGSVPRDYQDRCPKCGYSKLEDQKNNATNSGDR